MVIELYSKILLNLDYVASLWFVVKDQSIFFFSEHDLLKRNIELLLPRIQVEMNILIYFGMVLNCIVY